MLALLHAKYVRNLKPHDLAGHLDDLRYRPNAGFRITEHTLPVICIMWHFVIRCYQMHMPYETDHYLLSF